MLPGVKFKIENGALGGQDISADGVSGIILSGVAGVAGEAPSWELEFDGTPPVADSAILVSFPDGTEITVSLTADSTLAELATEFASQIVKEGYVVTSPSSVKVLITAPLVLAQKVIAGDLSLSTNTLITLSDFSAGVVPGIELLKLYRFTALKQAEEIGILEVSPNALAHRAIKEFFEMAAEGSELFIYLVAAARKMSEMVDKDYGILSDFISKTNGRVRNLAVSRIASETFSAGNSLDEDVDLTLKKGEISRKYYAEKMQPFRLIVDGKNFDGESISLKDYRAESYSGVAVFLGSSDFSSNASIGLLLGSKAQLPVQRKVSRVKNGKLPIEKAYFTNGELIENEEAIWEECHNKGYIFLRTYPNRSGYYFSSDTTCTSLTDDYSSLSRGSVIDKAMLIAYDVFVEEIDDEIDTNENGDLDAGQVKDLQSTIEETLNVKMVQNGECTSVLCVIDPTQDTMSTGELEIVLRVKPRGYKTYINVSLGFTL